MFHPLHFPAVPFSAALRPGALALAALAFTACGSRVGPRSIEASFPHYGDAIHSVIHEDLLQNLVRRRYQESPQFIYLGSITQTKSVSTNARVGANFDKHGFLLANGEAGAATTDYPTFSIVPQQGAEFAEKIHDRLPLKVIPQMANTGYPVELLFTLLAQEVAGVPSVYISTDDSFRPASPRFITLLNAMKALEDGNQLKIENVLWEEPAFAHPFAPEVFSPGDIVKTENSNGKRYASMDGGQTFYVTSQTLLPSLWVSPEARSTGAGRELFSILRLDPQVAQKAWPLEEVRYLDGKDPEEAPGTVTIRTRSFYGVLNLLAHGVRIPGPDGIDLQTIDQGYGKAVAAGLAPDIANRFVVHFSRNRPHGAFVETKTHGGWYWIDAADRSSKEIFNALFDLYQLQIPITKSESSSSTPVLSIPTP